MKTENEIRRAIAHWEESLVSSDKSGDTETLWFSAGVIDFAKWVLDDNPRMEQLLRDFRMVDQRN